MLAMDELLALSPLDGRYAAETAPLQNYFSEFAYLRARLRIEMDYLLALARAARLTRPLTASEISQLQALVADFSLADAREIKALERVTRHDVKAIENFLRARLAVTSLADGVEWLHFGLTSEDVNQTAHALALRDSRERVVLPALDELVARLAALARAHTSAPMLARTHGQPAVPTTLGKELAVYVARLRAQRARLSAHRFQAKLTGAVGNFNALVAAAPNVDWRAFSAQFIRTYDLEPNLVTTQLAPFDNWVRYFDALRLTNSILLDLAQDLWRYSSEGYLVLRVAAAEVGSSTMPHKVNPIDFENAEGNLGIANALLEQYARKLPITRLQRDLSDSTVRRTFGVALGHTLVAYVSLARGLERIEVNAAKMRADLDAHWEIIAEGAQTILRAAGVGAAYEQLKALTHGQVCSRADYHAWIESLAVDDALKARLRALTPFTYVGLAEQIAEETLGGGRTMKDE